LVPGGELYNLFPYLFGNTKVKTCLIATSIEVKKRHHHVFAFNRDAEAKKEKDGRRRIYFTRRKDFAGNENR
jgi:hypothetical protein